MTLTSSTIQLACELQGHALSDVHLGTRIDDAPDEQNGAGLNIPNQEEERSIDVDFDRV